MPNGTLKPQKFCECGEPIASRKRKCVVCVEATTKVNWERKRARRVGGAPAKYQRRPNGSPRKPRSYEGRQVEAVRRAEREGRAYVPKAERLATLQAEAAARRDAAIRLREEAKRQAAEQRAAQRAADAQLRPWLASGLTRAERFSLRYQHDPEFNLRQRLRAGLKRRRQGIRLDRLLRSALARSGNSPRAEAFVGYTMAALRAHFEKQFTAGMSWAAFCDGQIHIDHIVPLASFDLSSPDEVRAAWAMSNLRPAWEADNLAKADRRTHLL